MVDSTLFNSYLLGRERIRWSGQPKQGIAFGARDALLAPFSLMWGGFAIFWNAMVWFAPFGDETPNNPNWFFKLWGLPFLVIGLYLIFGRFFHDAYLRKRQFYAVTDRRVLILRGSKFTSLDIDRLPRIELSEHRDGTGTLGFEASNSFSIGAMNGFSWWLPAMSSSAQFFRVLEPRKVYELILDQTRSLSRP